MEMEQKWNRYGKVTNHNQSGYEPLNLENGSSVDSDNFDATDLRF